jgi:hypothetical protein
VLGEPLRAGTLGLENPFFVSFVVGVVWEEAVEEDKNPVDVFSMWTQNLYEENPNLMQTFK